MRSSEKKKPKSPVIKTAVIKVDCAIVGKPVLTGRQWKSASNPVMTFYESAQAYFSCVNLIRIRCREQLGGRPPEANLTREIKVRVEYRIPKSRMTGKNVVKIGDHKRTKPDGDNVLKTIGDALWSQAAGGDHALGDETVMRRYGEKDQCEITIHYEDASCTT